MLENHPVIVGIRAKVWERLCQAQVRLPPTTHKAGKRVRTRIGTKDLSVLVDDRLVELNNSMAILTVGVDEMDKRLEEHEFMRDFEELHAEVKVTINSMLADVNKEIQALKASEATKDAKSKLMKQGSKRWRPNLRFVCLRWPMWTIMDRPKCSPPQRVMLSDL